MGGNGICIMNNKNQGEMSAFQPTGTFCCYDNSWGLPGRILEAQAKLVSLVGSALQMETQPEWERERETWGDQYFEKLIPILYFPWSTFIHWDVMQKSRGVSSPDFYQSQVLHTKVYRGLRGVTSSSGQGACWQFMTLSLWQWLVNTYFSRGDYS